MSEKESLKRQVSELETRYIEKARSVDVVSRTLFFVMRDFGGVF